MLYGCYVPADNFLTKVIPIVHQSASFPESLCCCETRQLCRHIHSVPVLVHNCLSTFEIVQVDKHIAHAEPYFMWFVYPYMRIQAHNLRCQGNILNILYQQTHASITQYFVLNHEVMEVHEPL